MLDVVRDMCGVHAQVMSAAELSLWARVDGIERSDVHDALWEQRSLVKTWAMRGTLHLLRADDLPIYTAALRARREVMKDIWFKNRPDSRVAVRRAVAAIDEVLSDRPMTREEVAAAVEARPACADLGPRLRDSWGSLLAWSVAEGHLCFGPNRGRNVTFVDPRRWLQGFGVADGDAMVEITRAFLHSHGPATKDELARWWGIPPKHARVELQRLDLEEVDRDEQRAFAVAGDVASINRSRAGGVRLLPHFDQYTMMSLATPRVFIAGDNKPRISREAGWTLPVLLVDGVMSGVWRLDKRAKRATVDMHQFVALSASVKRAVRDEVDRLAAFIDVPVRLSLSRT